LHSYCSLLVSTVVVYITILLLYFVTFDVKDSRATSVTVADLRHPLQWRISDIRYSGGSQTSVTVADPAIGVGGGRGECGVPPTFINKRNALFRLLILFGVLDELQLIY